MSKDIFSDDYEYDDLSDKMSYNDWLEASGAQDSDETYEYWSCDSDEETAEFISSHQSWWEEFTADEDTSWYDND